MSDPGSDAAGEQSSSLVLMAHTPALVGTRYAATNDNLDALRFYQRRGLRLAAVHVKIDVLDLSDPRATDFRPVGKQSGWLMRPIVVDSESERAS